MKNNNKQKILQNYNICYLSDEVAYYLGSS